jgi:hypothetical protein
MAGSVIFYHYQWRDHHGKALEASGCSAGHGIIVQRNSCEIYVCFGGAQ